jgi:hypothetical protein
MEEDKPVSWSEAPRAPALAPEEDLSIPVAGLVSVKFDKVDISRRDQMSCLALPCVNSLTYFTNVLAFRKHCCEVDSFFAFG